MYDADGSLRGILGAQADGTTALVVTNGPPPPAPSTPVVAGAVGGLSVTWDGTFAAGAVAPLDFARVEVHTSPNANFTPTAGTFRGTVESPRGGTLVVTAGAPLYVRLLSRNTSGTASDPSPAAGPIPPGVVGATGMAVGANGNLVPDPSFETGYVATRIAVGNDLVKVVDGGNNSAHSLRFASAGDGLSRVLWYGRVPIAPGDQFWLAADYKCSTDYAGGGPLLALRWYDSTGTWLDSGIISLTTPAADDTWRRLTGPLLQAPEKSAYAEVRLQSTSHTAGALYFDNVECRPVLSSAASGQRAEVSPAGLRLYDDQGDEAVSLVTGAPNYLTLRSATDTVATIDQAGVASFQSVNVADQLTWRGDDLGALLAQAPRGLLAIDYQAASVTATGSEMGFVELAFDAEADRMYRVVFDAYAQPSAAGGEVIIYLRDGKTAIPSITSTQIQSATYPMPTAGLRRVRLEDVRPGSSWGAGTHRLLISFKNQSGPSGQTVQLKGGGSYHGLFYVEDVGDAVPETGRYNTGGGSTTTPPPTTPTPQKYTKTYQATWSGSYAKRAGYNSYYGNQMLQGYYSSTNGIQASLCGFGGSLASDLSGATIIKAELYLYFAHWYYNDGGKAVIKAHGLTSRPSTFSSDSESMTVSWARNQGKWVDITSIFDSTKWRGIALDPNSTNSTYYGRAQGVGEANPPQLRVTYTK
jgi:hypothetical protein